MSVKIAVIYYSTYGHNHQMAETAAEAARKAGAEVRLLKCKETAPKEVVEGQAPWKATQEKTASIPEAGLPDLDWADGYIFSCPTRYGSIASQMRAFLDTTGSLWAAGKLAGKTVTAMTSAQNPHGGQETTLWNLYVTMMHWGAILVPPGYTDKALYGAGGNPYGTSVTATEESISDATKAAIRHQATRLVEVTKKLKG